VRGVRLVEGPLSLGGGVVLWALCGSRQRAVRWGKGYHERTGAGEQKLWGKGATAASRWQKSRRTEEDKSREKEKNRQQIGGEGVRKGLGQPQCAADRENMGVKESQNPQVEREQVTPGIHGKEMDLHFKPHTPVRSEKTQVNRAKKKKCKPEVKKRKTTTTRVVK